MPCWHWRRDRIPDRDTVPAGIITVLSLSGKWIEYWQAIWKISLPPCPPVNDRFWIRKRKTIHLQKGLGRQLMLSDSITVRTQERRCRRKSTGCWWMKLTVRTSWKQRKKWLSNLMVVTTKNVFISILAVLPLIWHEKVPFLMKKLLTFCFR